MAIIQAYAIYDGRSNKFIGTSNPLIDINCERLAAYTPRPVWLKRYLANGSDGTEGNLIELPTIAPDSSDLADSNTLQGYWIEQDGYGVMVDVAFVTAGQPDNFQVQCSSSTPSVATRFYTSGIPTFIQPSLFNFCISRTDDGSVGAVNKLALDYNGSYVGNVSVVSRTGGVTKYQIQAFVLPIVYGTDTIAAGVC